MAASVKPSYLTCTAAQAQEYNEAHPHNVISLNQLLETRAISHPHACVAGFPEYLPKEDRWQLLTFTFSSLLSVSDSLATYYVDNTTLAARSTDDTSDRIVALLSPSCADLLLTLFAAVRLGYGILLLAPQNTTEAIVHLCRTTKAAHLICHTSLLAQGRVAGECLSDVAVVDLASRAAWETPARQLRTEVKSEAEKYRTALIMHTSGSTGMPKPVYHPHHIWTEAIPCIPGKPAFTTTPLFHGGSADLLRSMNAVSILYIFSSTYPMTVKNIVEAVAVCPGTDAFLSVPYILKLLAEHPDGLKMLRVMDLVSTGGAPLPEALGNEMVRQGVRLVSRLGSSECGFLMSSHRDYERDKEWSWLRNHGLGTQLLHFEPMGDSEGELVFELVVDRSWSTRVVSNRPDGSFASGDLYAKHPTIPNVWRYYGRTDDIIVLVTGKKVSANPIETALRACPSISEAIVFGAERPALGVLILPASASTKRNDILERVHLVNESQSSYAGILDDLVVLLPPDAGPRIPKTSKGSVTRPKALAVFAQIIDEVYRRLENGMVGQNEVHENVFLGSTSEENIRGYLRGVVSNIFREARRSNKETSPLQGISDDEDLFNAGIDSVRAILVRSSLQKIVAPRGKLLANNVVFEHPSISSLARHVIDILNGDDSFSYPTLAFENQHRLMVSLVEQYSIPFSLNESLFTDAPEFVLQSKGAGTVILTGATGSLGAHVMNEILSRTSLRVIALVRAESDVQALHRLKANIEKRKLANCFRSRQNRVRVLASDLAKERLGLETGVYHECLQIAVAVIHIAWPVSFAMSLESFKPALEGTRNLLQFTARTQQNARFVFCSSTAAAVNAEGSQRVVLERVPEQTDSAAAMGYAQAKWVAEHICSKAHQTALAGRVVVARVGQLCGDTEHGVWNESEAWPLLIASVRYTKCLPVFIDEELSLLPVDVAAAVFIDAIESEVSAGGSEFDVPVLHVVNPMKIEWLQLVEFLESSGVRFGRSPAPQWVDKLEACASLDSATRSLIAMWRRKYDYDEHKVGEPLYDISAAGQLSASIAHLATKQVVSQKMVHKWVLQWRATGFLE